MTSIPPDTSPTPEELHAEVHRLVHQVVRLARAEHGPIPGVGTPDWWTAPTSARLAAILILGQAWLAHDPQRAIDDRFKALSGDISAKWSAAWSAACHGPSHAELVRRRAGPGPVYAPFDPVAATRWVETGSSAETAA